ncbi:MAG: hypothetical protein ACK521_04210 [bacterium]
MDKDVISLPLLSPASHRAESEINVLANTTFSRETKAANIMLTQSFARNTSQSRPQSALTNFSNRDVLAK